jgi:serine/threonine-protein kinase
VLFELVTGKLPFAGENIAQVYSTLFSDEVPAISRFRDDVPPFFERIVHRCLRKDPAERYGRADEVAQALADFLSGAASPSLDASERPTMISVAPALETKKSARIAIRSVGQKRWNSGWAFLSLMGLLALGSAVGNRLGLLGDLSGATLQLHSAVTPEPPAAALAGNTVSTPAPVGTVPLDAATASSVLPAPSIELSPAAAVPIARPAPADARAQRVAAMRAWNAWKARTSAPAGGLPGDAAKSGVVRPGSKVKASVDELIPPYGDAPELRAEVNDAKR